MGSLFGGKQTTTQQVRVDPVTEALNALRLEQLQGIFGVASPASFAGPRPDLFTLDDRTNKLIDEVVSGRIPNIDEYIKLGLDQTSNYISQIAKPQILSTLAQQGLETSGAVPTSIAKATAQVGLPFVQGIPAAAGILTEAQKGLISVSDLQRNLNLQDFLRQQGYVGGALSGIPYTPQTSSSTSQRIPSFGERLFTPEGLLTAGTLGGIGVLTGAISNPFASGGLFGGSGAGVGPLPNLGF